MSDLRSQILGAEDIKREKVSVPEWGGAEFYITTITGAERDQFEQSMVTGKGKKRDVSVINARAKLLTLAIVDDDGKRIFSDADVANLGAKSAAVLSRLYDVAARLNGITDEEIDDLEKN